MSYNNIGVIEFGEKNILEFENSISNDDEGGVGALNSTPYSVKPLTMVILFFVHGSYSPLVVT
jgi:hypothetical protein